MFNVSYVELPQITFVITMEGLYVISSGSDKLMYFIVNNKKYHHN